MPEGRVIWFYVREDNHLRCEVREHPGGDLFELVVTEPDGTERIEQFEDSASLNQRARELEQHWHDKGWDGPFARGI